MKVLKNAKIAALILIAAAIFCVWAGKRIAEKLPPRVENVDSLTVPKSGAKDVDLSLIEKHLPFGIPDGTTADINNPNSYLLVSEHFAISYNRSRSTPNWAAWRLTRADMGKLRREDSYRPDDRLPNGWNPVFPGDFSGSGFTRGHLCPNSDRDATTEGMASTFLMTNMVPQTYDLNAGPWLKLEEHLRNLARRGNTIYVVAGAYGETKKIRGKISVPTNIWKVALIFPDGQPPANVNGKTKVIAVDMPNISGIKANNWKDYRISVRDLERRTGNDFFPLIPREIQEILEVRIK
ncbi:MAG: DNA/RNA non-specific endonuclease [Pyrinomonadaceae bacterium]|nr:DNA/RNA non-specific endonuclease [Pyrinomonadaceae bacterium]